MRRCRLTSPLALRSLAAIIVFGVVAFDIVIYLAGDAILFASCVNAFTERNVELWWQVENEIISENERSDNYIITM